MSAVIQANCPGCKQIIRLPADWVHLSIHCKHCGAILQAKSKSTPSNTLALPAKPPAPASNAATPAPAAQARVSVADSEPIPWVLPVGPPASSAGSPRQRNQIAEQPATPDQSPLAVLAEAAATPVGRSRVHARRRGLGPWILVGFCFFVAVATGAFVLVIFASRMGWMPGYGPLPSSLTVERDTEKDAPVPSNGTAVFPRRALVISVNNYLYANPVNYGIPGHSVHTLVDKLSTGLRIPKDQIAELSDAAPVA
ncbi:MAG TPA: hypothetical protein VGG61_16775, partial [Gemmataceae bacterium]